MDDIYNDTFPDLNLRVMLEGFEETPGDLAGYGVVADRFDELGYASIAHAFRWMHRRGIWPHKRLFYVTSPGQRKVPPKNRWAWYDEFHDPPRLLPVPATYASHRLPALVAYAPQMLFASHQAAVMLLASRLSVLKSAYETDPPKRGL